MGHVVFLRAANVGGKNVFRPARLARDLEHLGVVNVGAAGTFVVRGKASAAAIRREILQRLPFEPALAVIPAREVLALVESAPFAGVRFSKDRRGWVAVLDRRPARDTSPTGARVLGQGSRPQAGIDPRHTPVLPLFDPAKKQWSVRFDRVDGRFALGLWQRRPGGFVFPNQVVEKAVGVPATTRWWETMERVVAAIEDG